MSTVVLYPPPLALLGAALAKLIGGAEVLCTNQLAECEPDTAEGNNSVAVFCVVLHHFLCFLCFVRVSRDNKLVKNVCETVFLSRYCAKNNRFT